MGLRSCCHGAALGLGERKPMCSAAVLASVLSCAAWLVLAVAAAAQGLFIITANQLARLRCCWLRLALGQPTSWCGQHVLRAVLLLAACCQLTNLSCQGRPLRHLQVTIAVKILVIVYICSSICLAVALASAQYQQPDRL